MSQLNMTRLNYEEMLFLLKLDIHALDGARIKTRCYCGQSWCGISKESIIIVIDSEIRDATHITNRETDKQAIWLRFSWDAAQKIIRNGGYIELV